MAKFIIMNKKQENKVFVFGITLVATLGGLLFGYDTAVISGAEKALQAYFHTSNLIHGITTSSALIGCIIGGAVSGVFASKLGRRKSLQVASVLFFLSALGSGYPEFLFFKQGSASLDVLIAFNIYRIMGGIGVGLASAISPMYIAEIAPADIRGKLVSWNQFAIIFGMLVVYFVNYSIAVGQSIEWINVIGWRRMFASEAIPASLFGILLFFVPETPRYLVLNNKEDKAFNVLKKISGIDEGSKILEDIKATVHETTGKVLSYGWKILIVGILLSVFQQFVGINVVLYYAPRIFQSMGAARDASMMQTVVMGFVNIVFTLVAILTVDKFGRKPLLIVGSIGMAIAMFAISGLAYAEIIGVSTLVFIIIYTASFMMSWGPICWVLISEIFPNTIRSKAVAIAVAAQWIANFLVSSTFPSLINFDPAFTYALYGCMAVLSAIFVWRMVPETKGKTLEEMSKLWKK